MARIRYFLGGAAILATLAAGPVLAQGQDAANEINRIINELERSPASTPGYDQRIQRKRLRVRPDIAQQNAYDINAIIEERDYVLNYNHTEDFTVNFRFDSFAITPQARDVLDYVGQALTDPRLANEIYLVGGHTDTVGSDGYNQWLSERRAYAVVDYLATEWGIDYTRLEPVGFGETELLDPRRGANQANRRVEFTLIEELGEATPVAGTGTATTPVAATPRAAPDPADTTPATRATPATPATNPTRTPVAAPPRDTAATRAGDTGNVVCDSQGRPVVDSRPARHSLDDFGGRNTPVACAETPLDRAQTGSEAIADPGTAGTNAAIDDTNAAIGN